MGENLYSNLTNIYSVSKTLRFELIPQGKTLENIKKKGLIEEDEQRDKDFHEVKKIMDKYFKYFIEKSLSSVRLEDFQIKEYFDLYENNKRNKNDEKIKVKFVSLQNELRNNLHKQIDGKGYYKFFFKKEFIKDVLPKHLKEENKNNEISLVSKFKDWNTYFTGFYDNRKNIFSTKDIPTSIYFRLINDNLPKYIENVNNYNKLKNHIDDGLDLTKFENDFKNELNSMSLDVFFSLYNFNSFLTQKGIDKFNEVIGGKTLDDGKKVQGLNEYINLYSQKKKDKSIRKLKFIPLFKQILSDKESSSFIIDNFANSQDLINNIELFYEILIKNDNFEKIKNLFSKIEEFDRNKVYIRNDKTITFLSQKIFGDWSIIEKAIKKYAVEKIGVKNNEKELDKWYKKNRYFSIYEIEEGIELLNIVNDMDSSVYDIFIKKVNENTKYPICGFYSMLKSNDDKNLFDEIHNVYEEYTKFAKKDFNKENEKETIILKNFLESIINLYHFIDPFFLRQKGNETKEPLTMEFDSDFYSDFNHLHSEISEIIPIYNKTRNFVTKKDFSTKKFKLNFQNNTLLNGWDLNKETANSSVLLRKDSKYFLGIMSKGNNKIFTSVQDDNTSENYEKIVYKLLPGPEKMLPKVIFSAKNIKYFNPPKEIEDIRNYASHTKNGSCQKGYEKRPFNINDCHKMIEFYKSSLNQHEDWKDFSFTFKETKDYGDMSEFNRDVAEQGYKISFRNISKKYIDKMVSEGKLFLFQIYNKDFSKYQHGRKNLHTLYWEELFSEDNLKDVVYKLNGEAEIFFRKASLKRNITHPKNETLDNKDPINNKKTSIFKYDLIKDKRYTEDKFLFHCPITLNFKARDLPGIINYMINEKIQEKAENFKILSIDRGERHLAYYTLLDSNGKIIKQGTYNLVVDDMKRKRDYHEKLNKLEGERDEARKSWKQISNIKELKEGYLSQIVHQISKLAIEENALIVFEDLNVGFKRGRFKIEKQVYQKFEKMLIEKLNFLVFKDKNKETEGGILKAYQLTPKFESFQKMGKQTGIIYYVNADYTSKIDYRTGFINLLHPKYENVKKSKEFFKKFKNVKYHNDEDLFEFNFDYSDFGYPNFKKNNWSIWSNGEKIINFRNPEKNNQFDIKIIKPNDEIKKLFNECEIDYKKGDILKQILEIDEMKFFKKITYILKIILQLRNSSNKTGDDYILSCVKDINGQFFDSRDKNVNEPEDADANGAYHIGIKGLMVLDRIKTAKDLKKIDKAIKRDDFVNYIIERRWKTI